MTVYSKTSTSRLRVVVTGLVGLHPIGGVAWDYLQYVIGLARLGHDVYYHEDTWSWPYNPVTKQNTDDASYSVKFLSSFFSRYAPELKDRWHYLHLNESSRGISYGMSRRRFDEVIRSCDLFINVSGANLIPDGLPQHCVKVFLDTDPGYNQIVLSERPRWAEKVDQWCELVKAHDCHFTYAENIHGIDCRVPELDYNWIPTRMPIVMSVWNDIADKKALANAPWTTVMSWNAFKGPLIYKDIEYKSKGAEFEKILTLPRRTDVPLMLAVGGITSSFRWFAKHHWELTYRVLSKLAQRSKYRQLESYNWLLEDGPNNTLTPDQYRKFIAHSRGEVSIAKNVYVAMKTGWFSCRTACYLAAGRPAVVQDTGFSQIIPCGEGLFAFNTEDEAAAGLEAIEADYLFHSRAARAIAEDYFDSDRVLGRFVEDAMESCSSSEQERITG
jgi:hypothetical protein